MANVAGRGIPPGSAPPDASPRELVTICAECKQVISLHDRYDAMASVATYLKSHGWTLDATEARQKAIIRKYNNSGAYSEAVLQLARRMEEHR